LPFKNTANKPLVPSALRLRLAKKECPSIFAIGELYYKNALTKSIFIITAISIGLEIEILLSVGHIFIMMTRPQD